MAKYLNSIKGYIADVPRVWFKRCDGHVFYYDEITQASATPNTQFTEVNAGWSPYPVAYLPGQSTMELQMTSGQFNADLFAMANARTFGQKARSIFKTEHLTIAENKVTLSHTPVEGTIFINGLEQDDTAAEGKFAVSGKEITFVGE